MAIKDSCKSAGCISVVNVYGKLSFAPAGISTVYFVVVRFLTIRDEACAPGLRSVSGRESMPPTMTSVIGAPSLLVMSRRAWVPWPLMILGPKISALGKEAVTETSKGGASSGAGVIPSLAASSGDYKGSESSTSITESQVGSKHVDGLDAEFTYSFSSYGTNAA